LLLTGLVYAVLYVLLIGPVQVDFTRTANSLVFLVFFGLTAPIVFGVASLAAKFFIYHPLERIIQAENNIAVIFRSSQDLNRLMSSLAKEIAQVIDYKEIFIYLAKRNDAKFFHQVYPVGERTLHMDHDLILQYLAKNQDLMHSPEVHYLGTDSKLSQELVEHHVDISCPIYYNNQLLGVLMLDNNKKLLYQQQLDFLREVNKYLDIAIGSLLLYQQAMANQEEK
jgi:transcriptional regulator with GAF, ATPase, and Fis domain